MDRDVIGFILTIIVLFTIVSFMYLKPLPEQYATWIIVGLIFALAAILYILRNSGALPSKLITQHLPFPLALLSPSNADVKEEFTTYILPAVSTAIELLQSKAVEKSYRIIKLVREFFNKELKDVNLGNTEAIRKKLESLKLYNSIKDANERKNAQYSLASLIHWIARYRNLAMHSPRVDADPIDAWFALRITLIYVRARYPQEEALLYTKCPRCGALNTVKLRENSVSWLKEISLKCTKCGYKYKTKITPSAIIKHYQILDSIKY